MPQVAAALAPIAINFAIGFGASLLGELFRPQRAQTQTATTSRGLNLQVTVGESVPVSTIVGLGRTAGHLIFAQEYGANNEYLKLVITMGKGRFDGLETMLADEKALTLTGSNDAIDGRVVEQYRINEAGEPSPTGTPHLWIKIYDGRPGQAADPGLIAAAGGSGRWGAMHKATGTPYVIITLRYQANLFPSATLPRFGFIWRGLRLYDWRKDSTVLGGAGAQRWNDPSTWTWTENPAVIAWNYRRGFWVGGVKFMGFGFSQYANDLAYFTAAANIADEPVLYSATGVTLPRYAFGREISDDEDRLSVQRELEASWCGSGFDRGGAYAPLPAAQQIPVMTLDFTKRVDGTSMRRDRHGSVSAKKTAWHGTFSSVADKFVPTPFEQRINVGLETLIRGRRPVQFNQPFEYRQERAQMRAEVNLRRNLYPATVTATFGPQAKVLEPGDPVTLQSDWGDMLMVVEEVVPSSDDLGRQLTLRQWDNAIVPASGEGFESLPAEPGAGPADPDRTIYVPSFAAAPFARSGGGAVHPYGRAVWVHITDPNVDQVMIRVWPTAGDEQIDGETFFANPRLQDVKLFGPLQALTEYSVKAIPIRKDGRLTFWSEVIEFTSGGESAPIAPGSITPEMLGTELANQSAILMGDQSGSIPDQLARLKALQETLAGALVDVMATHKQRLDVLDVQRNGASAAIIRTEQAIVEEGKARALAIQELIANIDNVIAGGFLKFQVEVVDEGAEATITAKVRASSGLAFSQSAWIIRAMADGLGGTESEFGVIADTFRLYASSGAVGVPIFSVDEDGTVTVEELRFKKQSSVYQLTDGTPVIVINGQTGYFAISVEA